MLGQNQSHEGLRRWDGPLLGNNEGQKFAEVKLQSSKEKGQPQLGFKNTQEMP